LRPFGETESRYYVRMLVADQPGVLAQIAQILGDERISIASCIQKETDDEARVAELVIMTHPAQHDRITRALDRFDSLPITRKINSVIRVGR
jgi:homoserine dehydrogenase